MVRRGRKTFQGFLAALLLMTGILTSGSMADAAESAADMKTGTKQAEVSLIAYEIPIEEISATAESSADEKTELTTEESPAGEKTELTTEESPAGEKAERATEEVRIGAKTSDMTGVQVSIFRYACSAMFAAMLFLAELLHIQKREKEGE